MKQENTDNQQPQQFGPAPVAPDTQYEQQPVNQQYFAQPQAAPVQYIVQAESLKGVKGWLLFFTICFSISGLAYTGVFFTALESLHSTSSVINAIFSPIIVAAAIGSVVLISMQKRIAKVFSIAYFGIVALVNTIYAIVALTTGSAELTNSMSTIVAAWMFAGLMTLYFTQSRRVKETLVV